MDVLLAFNQKIRFCVLLIAVILLMTGCLGSFSLKEPIETTPLKVTIVAGAPTISVGESVTLTASVQGADDVTITWASSLAGTFAPQEGPEVAWTPESEGQATITAKATAPGHDKPAVAAIEITVQEGEVGLCGSGDETEDDPRIICTVQQLQDIKLNTSGHYKLGSHIDASETSSWDGGGFEPIVGFSGTLDGNGFTIIGLHIDRPEGENIGLFTSILAAGEVRNLGIVDGYVRGKQNVGAIAGRNLGTIRDSYNAGEVHGVDGFGPIGGLAGVNHAGTAVRPGTGLIVNSYNSGKVGTVGFVVTVGGIVGHNHSGGKVEDSYNIGEVGSVESSGDIGGVVGLMDRQNRSGTEVVRSHNEGVVIGGGSNVGGVVGRSYNGVTVRESYNLGSVTAESDRVGGVVGYNNSSSVIENSYSIGVIEGRRYVGGVVGDNGYDSSVIDSWNGGSVDGREDWVGGVAGINIASSSIIGSYTTSASQVTGGDRVGGVAGANSASVVEASYNAGTVHGISYVGGVVGDNSAVVITSFNTGTVYGDWTNIGGVVGHHFYDSSNWMDTTYIEDSYNTGSVIGLGQDNRDQKSFRVGGVVGNHRARITNTYNTGSVTGDQNVGGLVGARDETHGRGVIESSYFSQGPNNYYGIHVSEGALTQESTFHGWDFTGTWTTYGDMDYADLIDNPRP